MCNVCILLLRNLVTIAVAASGQRDQGADCNRGASSAVFRGAYRLQRRLGLGLTDTRVPDARF